MTSSSLEVLAALSFDDKGFAANMAADEDGRYPDFYKRYVDEIIRLFVICWTALNFRISFGHLTN